MPEKASKIILLIPPEFTQRLMESVNEAITPFYPGYDMCFSVIRATGTWRPLEGSHPYDGEVGKISTAEEDRVEFIVREEEVPKALEAIIKVHPYEEPAIDVIPCYGWRSCLHSSGGL